MKSPIFLAVQNHHCSILHSVQLSIVTRLKFISRM